MIQWVDIGLKVFKSFLRKLLQRPDSLDKGVNGIIILKWILSKEIIII
jgi:hypothetical protein